MFMGTYYNSIDEKNRMIVPSKHRDQLGGKCILAKGIDQCLNIYTMEDWQKQVEKLMTLPQSNSKVRRYIRDFAGNAVECSFDKQGRINIPNELKAYAGIDKDLVTIGAITKVEIWSKEVWEAPNNVGPMSTEELENALAEYGF
ncbi:MAG: division/cell wall cluster transcriptional repressor MraZ [Clostridia bacterium]|nr:division/cell wall cluster transcriptional repressor MraZ [Clostridia bacterium]